MGRSERLTSLILWAMIVGGVVLRVRDIGYPPVMTFDEHYYAPAAHHYILGVPDLRDWHPPLGKMLGAIGLLLFGFNSVGWRFVYLCFGIQTIVVAFCLARYIFSSTRAGWMAAGFVAADGFFISYSRAGLIDGMLTCLVLWSVLAVVVATSWRGLVLAAILVGAATSIKWSGAQALLPAIVGLLVFGRLPWYQVFWFSLSPMVHFLIWAVGLDLMGGAYGPIDLYKAISDSMRSLSRQGLYSNPLASSWYTWPILYRPIAVKLSHQGAIVRCALSVGNPVLWFPASAVVVGLPIAHGLAAIQRRWRSLSLARFDSRFRQAILVLAVGWLSMMLLFATIMGKHTFFYHYLPSYGFAIVTIAGVMAQLERNWPQGVLAFVTFAAAAAIYFSPIWGELPMTLNELNQRLLLPSWRF